MSGAHRRWRMRQSCRRGPRLDRSSRGAGPRYANEDRGRHRRDQEGRRDRRSRPSPTDHPRGRAHHVERARGDAAGGLELQDGARPGRLARIDAQATFERWRGAARTDLEDGRPAYPPAPLSRRDGDDHGATETTGRRRLVGDYWLGGMTRRNPVKLVAVALGNRTARTAWPLLRTGETYRASPGWKADTDPTGPTRWHGAAWDDGKPTDSRIGIPARTGAPFERVPLTGTGSTRTFIGAGGSPAATSTPHTWPGPTRRQKTRLRTHN